MESLTPAQQAEDGIELFTEDFKHDSLIVSGGEMRSQEKTMVSGLCVE
jgi:hypothetical protein